MAVNKIEIALKEALKKAMVKCNFVEDYEINQITIEIPKEYNIYELIEELSAHDNVRKIKLIDL